MDCSPLAWEFLKADYLRPEKPSFLACYRRLERTAKAQSWTVPSERTLLRRMDDLPEPLRVLARDGVDALKALYPAQTRDRGVFHALEAVNADGHKWDVFVRWPDGYVGGHDGGLSGSVFRQAAVLADRQEREPRGGAAGVRRMCRRRHSGSLPAGNGRAFASKWLTGASEPVSVQGSGRRAVRRDDADRRPDPLHDAVSRPGQADRARVPRFRRRHGEVSEIRGRVCRQQSAGETGNYGSKAVPLDVFVAVVAQAVAEHNARAGRRSRVCNGGRSMTCSAKAMSARRSARRRRSNGGFGCWRRSDPSQP